MELRNLLPTGTNLQLFKAAILPYVTFCHLVWHFCRASDSRELERVQERALRAIYCDISSSYEKLLNMANLCTLRNRRLQDIAGHMYKVKNNICPKHIADHFQRTDTKYLLRNEEFVIPRFNTITHGSILLGILALSYGIYYLKRSGTLLHYRCSSSIFYSLT